MKKSLKLFILNFVFFSQVMFSFIVIPVVLAPVLVIFWAIEDMRKQHASAARAEESRYRTWENHIKEGKGQALGTLETKAIPTSLQGSIRDDIDAILNDKIILEGYNKKKVDYPLFPTANSKIFVLKNIKDFFNLEYPVLNQFVYEESVRTIRNLENTLTFVPEMETINGKEYPIEGKGRYVDNDPNAKKIDESREQYMEKYGLSSNQLKYMEEMSKTDKAQFERELDNIIERVKNGLTEIIKSTADKIYYENRAGRSEPQAIYQSSPEYIAHMSILTYLMYWKAQPGRGLSASELEDKRKLAEEKVTYVEALESEFQNKPLKEISEPQNRDDVARMLVAQSINKMQLSETPIKEAQQKREKAQQEEETRKRLQGLSMQQQPVQQQSMFSRFKSWVNSWWY